LKNKSDHKVKIKTLLNYLKMANRNVIFIRYDNAGENVRMKNEPEIKSFGIKFEFLGPRKKVTNTL
jgi:hypothetical protein